MGRRGGLSGVQRMAGRNKLRGSSPIGGESAGGGGNTWIWVIAIILILAKCTG